jgi:hypothetical protein
MNQKKVKTYSKLADSNGAKTKMSSFPELVVNAFLNVTLNDATA